MGDSRPELYLHFVWATKLRQPKITPELEGELYRVIGSQVKRLGCELLALNGMPDHVHVVVRPGATLSPAQIMNQVKGASSRFLNARIAEATGDPDPSFRWQPGYGVFSLGRNQVPAACDYVSRQKEHHAAGTYRPAWEDTGEDDDTAGPDAPADHGA